MNLDIKGIVSRLVGSMDSRSLPDYRKAFYDGYKKILSSNFKDLSSLDVRLMMIASIILMLFYFSLTGSKKKSKGKSSSFVEVNCWFCNSNGKIKQHLENSWYCENCEQYNGFSGDGDYNKEISEMQLNHAQTGRDESVPNGAKNSFSYGSTGGRLCESCNRLQILKVKQLAAFVPTREDRFDPEIESYERQLEKRYRICSNCSSMLELYVEEQDMQIKRSIGDFDLIHDEKMDAGTPGTEHTEKNSGRKRRNLPSFWPSDILSVLSLTSAWCLLFTCVTGSFSALVRRFLVVGCTSRLLLWLMKPFSKRKMLLLVLWLLLFVLAPMKTYVGYDFFWLRSVIVVFESWAQLTQVLKSISMLPLHLFRAKRTTDVNKERVNFIVKNIRMAKTSARVKPEEKPTNIDQTLRKRVQSDTIDGRISTMSLGLTDSDDESDQKRRERAKQGSWFASARRFVGESETTKSSLPTDSKRGESKFTLQPTRLLTPRPGTVQPKKPALPEDEPQQPVNRSSELHGGERRTGQATGKCQVARCDDEIKSNRTSRFLGTCKSVIKLLLLFLAISSLLLNVYLLMPMKIRRTVDVENEDGKET